MTLKAWCRRVPGLLKLTQLSKELLCSSNSSRHCSRRRLLRKLKTILDMARILTCAIYHKSATPLRLTSKAQSNWFCPVQCSNQKMVAWPMDIKVCAEVELTSFKSSNPLRPNLNTKVVVSTFPPLLGQLRCRQPRESLQRPAIALKPWAHHSSTSKLRCNKVSRSRLWVTALMLSTNDRYLYNLTVPSRNHMGKQCRTRNYLTKTDLSKLLQ